MSGTQDARLDRIYTLKFSMLETQVLIGLGPTSYSIKVKATIVKIPAITAMICKTEWSIFFVFCNSGIKSATATYINPPAEIGKIHMVKVPLISPKKKVKRTPSTAHKADIKLSQRARDFV